MKALGDVLGAVVAYLVGLLILIGIAFMVGALAGVAVEGFEWMRDVPIW